MAINYLNTVNFNKNQLEQAAIQNLTANPASGVLGQVYYNTVTSELKICTTAGSPTGAVWTVVGSDNVTYDLSSAANVAAGVNINLTGSDSSTDTINIIGTANEVEIAQTGTANKIQIGLPNDVYVSNNLTAAGSGSFATLGVGGATTILGLVTAATGLSVTGGTLSASGSTTINLGANRVTNIADPTAAQDAATKSYVDAVTVGGLIYQGAYDPVTNTPDLDRDVVVKTVSIAQMGNGGGPLSSTVVNTVATTGTGQGLTLNITLNPTGNVTSATVANGGTGYAAGDTVGLTGLTGHSGSVISIATIATAGSPAASIGIEKGWTYSVVADGDFYGEKVRVGDVLIAESDNPGDLVNWTTVQNNIDLASATQVGIGNVAPSTGISVAYSGGTATVTNTDTNSSNTDEGEISAGSLSGTITHNWGTAKVIVQTYIDNAADNYPTVFCDTTRTSNTITATIATAETDDIVILAQKIG